MRFTAVTARGTEEVLARELTALGAQGVAPGRGFVAFEGELADAYRACMFVRSGSRVLMPIASFATGGPDELYAGVYAIETSPEPQNYSWIKSIGGQMLFPIHECASGATLPDLIGCGSELPKLPEFPGGKVPTWI